MENINQPKARVIALYLPQFHPIPENDAWWGKGFTEWTNVGKAKPLFRGHYQPRVPANLGYYDLRMPEVREAQAELAREAGIEGFCYWHYWFGDGKELLERPFHEVLESGKPDFPFCLGWANQSWTNRTWNSTKRFTKESVLIEQTYTETDHIIHFNSLLKAFTDNRYIKVDDKPIFLVFNPHGIPDVKSFIDLWNNLAIKNGLKGIHFVGITENFEIRTVDNTGKSQFRIQKLIDSGEYFYNRILDMGFDAVNSRGINRAQIRATSFFIYYFFKFINLKLGLRVLTKYNYSKIIKNLYVSEDTWENVYPTITPNWDRSPRSGKMAIIWHGSTPALFYKNMKEAIEIIKNKSDEHKLIFLQSWNEWGEGNYVEPDIIYGKGYLDSLSKAIFDR